jgi:hypothetical protein
VNEPDDENLGLFADVISGTLGIVVLLALILALSALDWNGVDAFAPRTLRTSELLDDRLAAATEARSSAQVRFEHARTALAARLQVEPEEAMSRAQAHAARVVSRMLPAGPDAQESPESARLRENLVLQRGIHDLETAAPGLDRFLQRLRARDRAARDAFARGYGDAPSTVPAASLPARLRVVVYQDRGYPTGVLRDGAFVRNDEDLAWIDAHATGRTRILPEADGGWTIERFAEALSEWRPVLVREQRSLVLLVHPDSFATAGALLDLILAAGVPCAWEPVESADALTFEDRELSGGRL